MKKLFFYLLLFVCLLLRKVPVLAQNPLIMNQFTADPSARVFEGKVYVYPSHDIPCGKGQGFIGFCMADYHVFSSENLTDWKDHGVILSQKSVPWVDSTTYSMWAPDCIFKNGKYYFYFPAISKNKMVQGGRAIGVAVSDKPYGPFIPETEPITGVNGIDPNVFIDKNGQAYIYWQGGTQLLMAKMKDNMKELAGESKTVMNLPPKFKEGPYLFERKGIYYFTFPYVPATTEQLVYAMGDNPMGPFQFKGAIMKESPTKCWTNHHSIIEYQGQWYLFYHHNDLSPNFDKNRSIKADSLFFNEDGTIRQVTPTLRGVGITRAAKEIQIDRYSDASKEGVSIDFLDTLNRMKGWKALLNQKNAWIRYNAVDFGKGTLKVVNFKATSKTGSMVEVRIDKINGPVINRIKIGQSSDWHLTKTNLSAMPSGKHDLFIILKDANPTEIDWIRFE